MALRFTKEKPMVLYKKPFWFTVQKTMILNQNDEHIATTIAIELWFTCGNNYGTTWKTMELYFVMEKTFNDTLEKK